MRTLLLILTALFLAGGASAERPECPKGGETSWHKCKGKDQLSNGSIYNGEWKKDKAHGKGTYTSQSGAKYIGRWKKGKPHGKGT